MSNFRKLRVWQAAQALAIDAHRIGKKIRGAQGAVIRDQMTRAAMSVPTNIIEGNAHASPREFIRFLRYSLASASEVEGHAQLARDLEMMTESDFRILLDRVVEVRMMLHGLLKTGGNR